MKHLVCPGPGKSGTTLLHTLFARNPLLAGPKGNKEYCFFRTPQSDSYETIFGLEAYGKKPEVLFEFSPPYMSGRSFRNIELISDRIKKELPDPFILFNLRHPIDRSISSYIHNLQYFSRFGQNRHHAQKRNLADPYLLSFSQAVRTNPNVGMLLSKTISCFLKKFGRDRVIFFNLENDTKSINTFYDFISEKLGIDSEGFGRVNEPPRVLTQKNIPRYYYNGNKDIEIVSDEGGATLPKGCLYLSNDVQHDIVFDIDPFVANSLMGAQKFWTTKFSAQSQERIFKEIFEDDVIAVREMLNETNCASQPPNYLETSLNFKSVGYAKPDVNFLKRKVEEFK